MILRRGDGLYAIYDIGNNATLAAHPLAQVGSDWQFAGLGGFQAGDTADMLLRNASTGGFQVYDISNNNITNTAFLGNVGMDWQVMGFGNFSSRGETDMILRNSNTGVVEVYDIANNQITGANFMGSVGLDWQFSGVAISAARAKATCSCAMPIPAAWRSTISANNAITDADLIGTVGLDWQFSGVGNFSGVAGETGLLSRNVSTGGLEVYDINNNQLTGTPLSSARSAWTGSSPALPRCAAPARPTSSCATSPPAHSRPTTSPTIKSSAPPAWDRWDWSGRSAASPLILRRSNRAARAGHGRFRRRRAAEELTVSFVNADTPRRELITIPQHA